MARKVNKKFLALFLGVVGAIGVAGAILFFAVQKSPEDHIAIGEAALAEGRYEDAFTAYGKAANKRKGDPDLVIKLGDILDTISSQDVENYRRARDYWRMALQVDPKNQEALERLFKRAQDEVNLGGRPDAAAFQNLRESATALLAVQPDHRAARRAIPISHIQGWLSDVVTESGQIDQAITQLEQLYEEDPADDLSLYFIARAKMRRAELAIRGGNSTGGQALLAEVEKLFDDAIAANPDDAGLHFRGAQTVTMLAAYAREADQRQEMFKRALARAEEARRLVQPDDQLFVDIHTTVSALRRQQGDMQGAEAVRCV